MQPNLCQLANQGNASRELEHLWQGSYRQGS
jgi:hypothetical protein